MTWKPPRRSRVRRRLRDASGHNPSLAYLPSPIDTAKLTVCSWYGDGIYASSRRISFFSPVCCQPRLPRRQGLCPVPGSARLPAPQPLHELREGGGPDDGVELAPIVGDEAHTLHHDVVHRPSPTALEQAVLDGNLHAAIGEESASHLRGRASDGLTLERDRREAVADCRQVGPLEEVRRARRTLPAPAANGCSSAARGSGGPSR